jgi:arabinose-5-phosphate isomerase
MSPTELKFSVLDEARRVIAHEAAALCALEAGPEFLAAIRELKYCRNAGGRVVTTGIGKSGLVAQRIAATFNVTRMPAWYIHPVDALHGDVGGVAPTDVLLLVSRSGESTELVELLEYAKQYGLTRILITAFPHSMLAEAIIAENVQEELDIMKQSDILLLHGEAEACPHGITPTTTATAAGVLGDALALTLAQARGLRPDDFAAVHSAGSLGRRARLCVKDIMLTGEDVGCIAPGQSLLDAMILLAHKRGTLVVENAGTFEGVVTAGDVARYIEGRGLGWESEPVHTLVTREPYTAKPSELVANVIVRMQAAGVMALPVLGAEGEILGMVHLHDALGARVT